MSDLQNFGLIRVARGKAELLPIPIPKVPDDYVLVRTEAIALNPTDWTTLDAVGDSGTLVGCDYAGVVVQVGKSVTKDLKPGDRVAGFGHGGNDANPENGAFARFISVKGDLQIRVPDEVSFEAASAVCSGVCTAQFSLYKYLGLPWPGVSQQSSTNQILIYGGSTATGTMAIQFAKISGWKVITVCSPKHFALMKERGADAVYDYHVPNVGKQIRSDTGGKITTVLDTVAVESSAAICADAIGEGGGLYCNLLGIDCPRPDVKSIFFLGYSISGEPYIFEGEHYEAIPEDYDLGRKFVENGERLWAEGKWQPHPQRVGPRGLLGALEGMQEMREGKVSGEKLVYVIGDTKWPLTN